MEEPKGSHSTRSKAAPRWTTGESLILVNELSAVESEWGDALPSFQKWQQIVENCNALDVNRDLNQCKRKWNGLLSEYRRAKQHDAAADVDESFPAELFDAVDRCVNASGKKNSVGGTTAMDTAEADTDSDHEAHGRVGYFCSEAGSSKQRRRMKRKKRRSGKLNPWGYFTSLKTMDREELGSKKENVRNPKVIVGSVSEESNADMKEQIMAAIIWENASKITATLEGKLVDDVDYKLADLKNTAAAETDYARRQGDMLINCLGKISTTLNQLCDLVQHCN